MGDAFIEASKQEGLPENMDFNGATQEGVGYYQLTTRHGLRCSASTAFLKPASDRNNLTVLTRTLVSRLLFDGRRFVGVELRNKAGKMLLPVFAGKRS